jgi:hypothetical protein
MPLLIRPGDKVLVIGTVETLDGHTMLVNIGGHNLQITDNDLAHYHGEPVTNHA